MTADGEGRPRGRRPGPRTASGSAARARSCSSTRCTGSTRPSRTPCCRRSSPGCWCSSAPPPRTPTSRSTRRCSAARRCSGSSRSSVEAVAALVRRGLEAEGADIDDDALALLAERANGDGRHVLTSLEVAVALAHEHPDADATPAPSSTAVGHARRRRGRPRHQGAPLRPRRPLRRHLRLHQEHPGLRPRRRPLLAGPHARGRRGRPLHRPAPGDPRVARTSAWPTPLSLRGRRRRRPGRRVRRAARGPAQPGPRRRAPGHRRPSRTGSTVAIGEARADVREPAAGEVPAAPARRPLPGGEEPRPRQGLRVPSRRPRRVGRPAVPARRARGPRVLRADIARSGGQGAPAHGTATPDASRRRCRSTTPPARARS